MTDQIDYPTLESLKEALTALGFRKVALTKSWKRRTHREALIGGFLTVEPKMKRAGMEALVLGLLDPIKARFQLHYQDERIVRLPYSHCRGDAYVSLSLIADVALPDHGWAPPAPPAAKPVVPAKPVAETRSRLEIAGLTPRGLDAAIAERALADGLSAGQAELLAQEAWGEYAE